MDRQQLSLQKYQQLFNGQPDPSVEADPELMEILRRFIFGEVFYIGDLNDRQRELFTVVALATMQTLPQLKAHVAAALHTGVEPVAIREAIYLCAPFIGFPKTLNALNTMNEVFKAQDIEIPLPACGTTTEADRYEKGRAIQAPLYGDNIQNSLEGLPEGFGEIIPELLTSMCFGDFYTREGLTLQERELVVLTILASDGLTPQLASHIRGNIKAGNSEETIYATLIHLIPYIGFSKGLNAINQVKETLK